MTGHFKILARRSTWSIFAANLLLTGVCLAQTDDPSGREDIERALDEAIGMGIGQMHLSEVLEIIVEFIGIEVFIDNSVVQPKDPALVDPNARYETDGRISNVEFPNTTVREMLTEILRPLGLSYSVQKSFIWISTPGKILSPSAEQRDPSSIEGTARIIPQRGWKTREEREEMIGSAPPPIKGVKWFNVDGPLTWEDLKGNVVLIDFWGIRCGPCVRALPSIQKLSEKFRESGLVVLGVHTSSYGDANDVGDFIAKRKLTYPIVLGTDETFDKFGQRSLPTYFLVDRRGNLVWGHSSNRPFRKQIEKLLNEPHTDDQ